MGININLIKFNLEFIGLKIKIIIFGHKFINNIHGKQYLFHQNSFGKYRVKKYIFKIHKH